MALMLQQMAEALVKTADLIEEADREAAGFFELSAEEGMTTNVIPPPVIEIPSDGLPTTDPPLPEIGYTTPLPGSTTLPFIDPPALPPPPVPATWPTELRILGWSARYEDMQFELFGQTIDYGGIVQFIDRKVWKEKPSVVGVQGFAELGSILPLFGAIGPAGEIGADLTLLFNWRSGEIALVKGKGVAIGGGAGGGIISFGGGYGVFAAWGASSNEVFEGGDWKLNISGAAAAVLGLEGGLELSIQAGDNSPVAIDPVSGMPIIGVAVKGATETAVELEGSITFSPPILNDSEFVFNDHMLSLLIMALLALAPPPITPGEEERIRVPTPPSFPYNGTPTPLPPQSSTPIPTPPTSTIEMTPSPVWTPISTPTPTPPAPVKPPPTADPALPPMDSTPQPPPDTSTYVPTPPPPTPQPSEPTSEIISASSPAPSRTQHKGNEG